jgi:ribosomal protein S6--L-glutamate ligase
VADCNHLCHDDQLLNSWDILETQSRYCIIADIRMRIGVLSRNQSLYSTRRIVQAARMRGHSVNVIDTMSVPVKIGFGHSNVPPHPLPDVEAIVPRIGTSITFYGLAVVRQFESLGVVTTATARAIARSRDKLHSLQVMSKSGLPIPSTTIVTEADDIRPAIELAGGLPVIVKLIRGTQGRGVFMATEVRTVEAILKVLQRAKEQMLVQEFVKESSGTDIRIIVVGNRCVAAMKRTAAEGEFRSNLHRGGTAEPFVLDQHTRILAARAAQVHGLGVAGVDLMQSVRGPLLLEVNSSPGLQGIEETTKVDVASEIVRFLEGEERKQKHQRQQRRKRKL